MGFTKEFKEFALKGNVIELAVGVVIGGAFGTIVNSLIGDVITPLLLKPALEAAHLAKLEDLSWGVVKYGKFLSSVISFLMVAFVLFLVVKAMNRLKRKEKENPAAPAEPTATEALLIEIRDELKKKSNT